MGAHMGNQGNWYKVGQCILGALTALAVIGIFFILFLTEG